MQNESVKHLNYYSWKKDVQTRLKWEVQLWRATAETQISEDRECVPGDWIHHCQCPPQKRWCKEMDAFQLLLEFCSIDHWGIKDFNTCVNVISEWVRGEGGGGGWWSARVIHPCVSNVCCNTCNRLARAGMEPSEGHVSAPQFEVKEQATWPPAAPWCVSCQKQAVWGWNAVRPTWCTQSVLSCTLHNLLALSL